MKPLMHEIDNVYICGDGKKFLDEKEAQEYQRSLEFAEQKRLLKVRLKEDKSKLKSLEQEIINIEKHRPK